MFDIRDILRKRALALLLVVNGLIAAFAIRPVATFVEDFRQDPSVNGWNPKPPIVAAVAAELPAGGETRAGALVASLTFDPPAPVAGEKTYATWTVTDKRGRPVPLDRTMHNIAMHAYGVRDDLESDIIHMHPTQQDEGADWKDMIIFPTPGRWSLSMQAPSAGTLYEFSTLVDVGGAETSTALADDARTRAMMQYEVALDAPERVVEGEAARFRFKVKHTPEISRRKAVENARAHHNLIIAHAGDGRIWNHHGDGSVDMIASKAPLSVVRRFTADDPFDYTLTFPLSGLWLVDFEYLGEAAPFIIRVEPKR
ncbi:MAG TPA: hypothetical protein VL426_07420 [Candidatus Binatia bacterium]|nr:hypothetical protein [Candidatus Binatia bacterium]